MHTFNERFQMRMFQRLPDVIVRLCIERIKIDAQRAREQDRILRDDGQPRAERMQTELGNVLPVDHDRTTGRLDDAEQCQRQARLARAGTPDDADLFATVHRERDAAQYQLQPLAVPHLEVAELHHTLLRPVAGQRAVRQLPGGFLLRLAVLLDTLHRHYVRLHVGSHAHQPVKRLRDLQCVRHGQPNQTGVHRFATKHGEQGSEQNDQITDHLKPHGKPAVGDDARTVAQLVSVHFFIRLQYESRNEWGNV